MTLSRRDMNLTLSDAERVLRYTDWSGLLHAEGEKFAVLFDGEPLLAEVVQSSDKEDEDNDRDLSVTVRIGEQYFRKTGWAQIGSHCYGEYEPSWNELKEVRATQKYVTVYDVI
jgi:hypothetical protein